jgi:hypothetical protein
MRMAARPLLRLISHLLQVRSAAQGATHLEHVRAHTTGTDIHSVGNRLTDYRANLARVRADKPTPGNLHELPLALCEPHLHLLDSAGTGLQIIDDIRRSALASLRRAAMRKWQAQLNAGDRGYLASLGCLDAGRDVLRHGSPSQQCTFLHVVTNSIHFHFVRDAAAGGAEQLQPLACRDCDEPLTLAHAAACPSAVCTTFRGKLQRSLLAMLRTYAAAAAWCARLRDAPLCELLGDLFPPAPSASADEQHRSLVTSMCGLFSRAQASRAARALGFDPTGDVRTSREALTHFRLLCLSAIDELYTERKANG